MKKVICTFCMAIAAMACCRAQGKVVINEFMPWTSNTCGGTTAEFVELLNFGPGPMNIGCYILTDGDYSITIPPNTIIQPGSFYVISGQSVIAAPCANIDSTITANLNWNTCNCTSAPIPATGDGFLTDGGMASEQVVLLSPTLAIVDAVVRTLPAEPSSLITTSTLGGQCTAKTFDLDLMLISYETIGQSAGRGNSFARKLDGDCGWVKDPQQSANATNNTPGVTSDVSYSFAVTKATDCGLTLGSINIIVSAANLLSLFPMSYTLAYDANHNNQFDLTDTYTNGSVISPNAIPLSNLAVGSYRITVGTVDGCNLKTFPFTIFNCGSVLPVSLVSFSATKNNQQADCRWVIENTDNLDRVIVEKSRDQFNFTTQQVIPFTQQATRWESGYSYTENDPGFSYVRLEIVSKDGTRSFSSIQSLSADNQPRTLVGPNPVYDQLYVQENGNGPGITYYSIYNASNQLLVRGERNYSNTPFFIPVQHLQAGCYRLVLQHRDDKEPVFSFPFIKI